MGCKCNCKTTTIAPNSMPYLTIDANGVLSIDVAKICAECAPTPPVLKTATYTPPSLDNGQEVIDDISVLGVLLSDFNVFSIEPSISSFDRILIDTKVIADDLVRIKIENQTGNDNIQLPPLTINIKAV